MQKDDESDSWQKLIKDVKPLKDHNMYFEIDQPSLPPAKLNYSQKADQEEEKQKKDQKGYSKRSITRSTKRSLSTDSVKETIKHLTQNNTPFPLPMMRQERQKYIFEEKLDLHGCSQDLAYTNLVKFLYNCRIRGKLRTLVITGKGSPRDSAGYETPTPYGILHQALNRWLRYDDMARMIAYFAYARAEDGGEGAFYLRLRAKIKN